MKTKIVVALHKAYWLPEDKVYLPVQVGRALGADLGLMGDATGDNISAKNPYYCELTALYWAWKNLDYDYLGICHYRRYFTHKRVKGNLEQKKHAILKQEDFTRLMQGCDVLVPKKRNYYIETVRSHYEHAHLKEDLDVAEQVLKELYPEYLPAFEQVMASTSLYRLNMFVMRRELVEQYCTWLFTILFEVEKRLDFSRYDAYQARVLGFLGERLFNVWLVKQQLRVQEVPVVNLESEQWGKKIYSFLKRKFWR